MTSATQLTTGARLTVAVIVAGFVICLAVNLPGHLSYDSVIQLLEGRTGQYNGWHPPVTSWILGVTDALLPGTALFVLLDAILIFGSLWVLVGFGTRAAWPPMLVALFLVSTPQYLIYPGIVWKDILFAGVSVAGFAALARAAHSWREERIRFAWLAASFMFFVLAALARQNGILILLAGVATYGWIAMRRNDNAWRTFAVHAGSAFAALMVTVTAANVALGTHIVSDSGAARQFKLLETYDLVGGLARDPALKLDVLDKKAPATAAALRKEGVALYSPQRNDPLAASEPLQDAIGATHPALIRDQWLSFIAHRPWLYLKTRAAAFAWVLLTPDIDACVPIYVGVSGPQDEMDELDLDPRWDGRDARLESYAAAFTATPVMQHGIYALLAIVAAVVLLRRRRDADIAIAGLQIAALAYVLSFFVISIACDYRYLYPLDLAAMTGWFYLALDWQPRLPKLKTPKWMGGPA